MSAAVWSFAECSGPAERLALALGIPCLPVDVHRFPDGESLVRATVAQPTIALLYRSLNDPNAKLIELLLAASSLRDMGIERLILVAPYLGYMRQDAAFRPGEAVSQRVIGQLIATNFDALLTVDPHLHRTARLETVVPGIPAISLSAAPLLVDMLRKDLPPGAILVGPDEESRQWIDGFANALQLDYLIGRKQRTSDHAVAVKLSGIEKVAGRAAILIDDVVSTGETLRSCTALLRQAGATHIEAIASHCLASLEDIMRMKADGLAGVRATDTVPCPSAVAPIAPLLAQALRTSGVLQD